MSHPGLTSYAAHDGTRRTQMAQLQHQADESFEPISNGSTGVTVGDLASGLASQRDLLSALDHTPA